MFCHLWCKPRIAETPRERKLQIYEIEEDQVIMLFSSETFMCYQESYLATSHSFHKIFITVVYSTKKEWLEKTFGLGWKIRSQGKAIIRIEDCKVFTKQEFLGIFG